MTSKGNRWFIVDEEQWCSSWTGTEKAERQSCAQFVKLAGTPCYPQDCCANEWMACQSLPTLQRFIRRPRFDTHLVFRAPPLLEKRSSTTLSCAASLLNSIWPWASSSSRMKTGPSSELGCWRSCGNAKTSTTGGSTDDVQRTEQWAHLLLDCGVFKQWPAAELQGTV